MVVCIQVRLYGMVCRWIWWYNNDWVDVIADRSYYYTETWTGHGGDLGRTKGVVEDKVRVEMMAMRAIE